MSRFRPFAGPRWNRRSEPHPAVRPDRLNAVFDATFRRSPDGDGTAGIDPELSFIEATVVGGVLPQNRLPRALRVAPFPFFSGRAAGAANCLWFRPQLNPAFRSPAMIR